MTKEKLQAKLAEYQSEHAKLLANLNAFNGAIEATKYWLAELEKPNEEDNSSNESPKALAS